MLKIPLILHFNQDLVEFSALASRVCYRGLLRTLLDSPIRANIHISGTLTQALAWLDPEPLDLIRTGLRSGQFELMGSTHAQNILLASDPWDNEHQIRMHQEVLQEVFGVRPDAFWNPERCWSQSLVPLLAGAGYHTVTVEDHILERSGGRERTVYETSHGNSKLRVVRDDERFKHLFNYAAWFGKPNRVHRFLDRIAAEQGDEDAVFAYAEDAEAMGLWGYAVDVAPEQTWERLARLLNEIAGRSDTETVLLRDLGEPTRTLDVIEDGSAAWMDASLQEPGRPYHEDGFEDWFHFIDTSPKLRRTRQQFQAIREAFHASPSAGPLTELARHTLLTHQYEFGCIGIGGPGTRVWSGAISAVSLLRMAAAEPGVAEEDWNGDGIVEILVREADQVGVFSPSGGRLLYWADLSTGTLVVGNPASVVPGPFAGETKPPEPIRFPWTEGLLDDGYAQSAAVTPPTPLGKFLPGWIWDPGDGELTLALLGDRAATETRETLPAQQGAFLDRITIAGRTARLDLEYAWSGLDFQALLNGGILLQKRYAWSSAGPSAVYRLIGRHDGPIELCITAEIAGDYAANLRMGRSAAQAFTEPDAAGVRTPAGETIRLTASHPGGTFSIRPGFHTWIADYSLALDGLDGRPVEFKLVLSRIKE